MLKSSFTPLRTNVGRALQVTSATVTAQAPDLNGFSPTIQAAQGIGPITGADFAVYFPEFLQVGSSTVAYQPMDGTTELPAPPLMPFDANTDPCVSVRGIVLSPSATSSRRMWIELELRLSQPELVGGVAYAGHALLPYTIDEFGELSSNFGLPREVRLGWRGAATGFIDDETGVVAQEPSSNGGFHYLTCGPVRTDRVFLRFSDFPRLIKTGSYEAGRFTTVQERLGLCIPFLYVFEHRESTRFSADIPGAALAALKHAADGTRSPGELIYFSDTPKKFFQLAFGSAFGQKRTYTTGGPTMRETFVSSPLAPTDQLVLYVDQTGDNVRCVAGIKVTLAPSALQGLASIPEVELEVYEVDPRQGFPPISPTPPSADKFATRLFKSTVASAGSHILRFVRPTSCRNLAIVMRHPAPVGATGYYNIGISSIELVQSAHVAISPRPARDQVVQAMHYRIIGEGLLDDYSRLGDTGLSLTVERVVAGERKEVLFSASSLLDLVQEGGAKLVANHRYFETVADTWDETATTKRGSWDEHESEASGSGWNRAETGEGVSWVDPATMKKGSRADSGFGFTAFGNSENRSRVRLIGYEGIFTELEGMRQILELLFPMVTWPDDPTGGSELVRGKTHRGIEWKSDAWRGQKVHRVELVRQLSLPPSLAFTAGKLEEFAAGLQQISDFLKSGAFPPTGPLPTFPTELAPIFETFGRIPMLNGTNASVSVGASYVVGANLGVSWAPMLPTLGYQTTDGSQGSISQQAQETGYSYAQHKTEGLSVNHTVTRWNTDSVMKRRSERSLQENSVDRRRRRGADVMWQGSYADVVVGKIPIGISMPATAGRMFRTTDESIVVRFGGAPAPGVSVDVWFDVQEEWTRDDS